jgi:Ca2+/Na+ antiporter
MRIRNRFDRLTHWMRSQITLRRVWYFYLLGLVIFIAVLILYKDSYWFQFGITLFSIAIVYLVMITSNVELRETTERQVKAFVENLQTVCAELKNVSNGINNLTSTMKEVQRTISESSLISQKAAAKAEEERRKRKESLKPQLSIKIEQRGLQLWVLLDTRRYLLTLWNSGSDAIGAVVSIGNFVSEALTVGTRKMVEIDIGHVNNFASPSPLDVLAGGRRIFTVQVRDIDRNAYSGSIQVSLPQPQWVSIPLEEV